MRIPSGAGKPPTTSTNPPLNLSCLTRSSQGSGFWGAENKLTNHLKMTKKTAVLTISGVIVNLFTDDNLTLAFGGMVESTPQTLAEAINLDSLVKISTKSADDNERIKAAKAVAIGATLIERRALTNLISALTVELKAERLETARLVNLIKISGGQPV